MKWPVSRKIECNVYIPSGIMIETVEKAVQMKWIRKNPYHGKMIGEFLNMLDEEDVKILVRLFNKIYKGSRLPKNWIYVTKNA